MTCKYYSAGQKFSYISTPVNLNDFYCFKINIQLPVKSHYCHSISKKLKFFLETFIFIRAVGGSCDLRIWYSTSDALRRITGYVFIPKISVVGKFVAEDIIERTFRNVRKSGLSGCWYREIDPNKEPILVQKLQNLCTNPKKKNTQQFPHVIRGNSRSGMKCY